MEKINNILKETGNTLLIVYILLLSIEILFQNIISKYINLEHIGIILFLIYLYVYIKEPYESKTKSLNYILILTITFLINHVMDITYISPSKFIMLLLLSLSFILLILNRYNLFKNIHIDINNRAIYVILVSLLLFNVISYTILTFTYVGNDEASYVYNAKLINEGKIPYKDFITRAPPVIYTYSAIMKIFGLDLIKIKIANVIFSTLSVLFIFLLGKTLADNKIGIITTIFYVFSLVRLSSIVTGTGILSNLFVLMAFYFFIKNKDNPLNLLVSGIFFSLAFFSRMIPILYFILLGLLLLILLIKQEDKRRCLKHIYFFFSGFIIPSVIIISYFSSYLHFIPALKLLTGIGSIAIKEANIPLLSSLRTINISFIFSIHLIIFSILYFMIPKKNKEILSSKNLTIIMVWLVPTVLFYFYYIFKRGFFLGYYLEILPVLCIISALYFKKLNLLDKEKTKFLLALLITILVISSMIVFPTKPFVKFGGPDYPFSSLIGSGVSFNTVKEVSNIIKERTNENDEILGGSLQWATESGRRQMLDISHPLAYTETSEVYTLYSIQTKKEVINYFRNHDIKIVIVDSHFSLAFNDLLDDVNTKYRLIKDIEGIKVYEKKS